MQRPVPALGTRNPPGTLHVKAGWEVGRTEGLSGIGGGASYLHIKVTG